MILAISTQPIKTIFAPLFWVLDEIIPKDEKPTLENFKKCYVDKCNKNQPPGDIEKRLLLELLGSVGIIGGAMLWAYGYFKNSKFWKYLGGGLSLGGLGTVITGSIQYARLGIDELLKLPKKSAPIEPDEKNKAHDNSEPVPKNRSLVPVSEVDNGDDTKTTDQDGRKDVIQDELAEPGYGKQLLNIGEGAVNKVAATTSDILGSHPHLKSFILIIPGGGSILLAVEAVKIFNEFRKGNFSFEYTDPKTGQKTEYSYSDDKTKNKILFEKSCETLGVNENSTEEEVKKAYRDAAKKYHPDRNLGDEAAVGKFKTAALAYEIIRKYRGWDKSSMA